MTVADKLEIVNFEHTFACLLLQGLESGPVVLQVETAKVQ
jgi:hypothetical protein